MPKPNKYRKKTSDVVDMKYQQLTSDSAAEALQSAVFEDDLRAIIDLPETEPEIVRLASRALELIKIVQDRYPGHPAFVSSIDEKGIHVSTLALMPTHGHKP